MDYRKHQYKILCEDKAHYNFVRGWLEKKNAHRRVKCYGELPHDGSGKSFVIKNFADALRKVQTLSSRVSTFLVVVIDADNCEVDDIIRNLAPEDNAPVFIIVAKWSIDTWARFLIKPEDINALNESESCKNAFRDKAKFTKLGKQLADINFAETTCLPASLQSTYDRIKKKKEMLRC